MGDIFGLIFTILLFLLIIFSKSFRTDKATLYVIILGFILHIGIAIYNGFVGPTLGADLDAISFYEEGVRKAITRDIEFAIGSDAYRNILGGLFYLFGPSMYLACVLSVAAYIISLFPIIYICDRLKLSKYKPYIIAAFSFLPSMFLFGSVALREAMEVCFFIFAVKYYLQFRLKKNVVYFFLGLFFTFLMGILHFGLLFFGIIMVVLVLIFNFHEKKKTGLFSKITLVSYIILGSLAVLVVLSQQYLSNLDFITTFIQGGSLSDYTEARRNLGIDQNARSGYEINLNFGSPLGMLISLLTIFVYYIAYPFPWTISNATDVYAFLEIIWRCLLIYYSIKSWLAASGEIKKIIFLLLMMYFALAGIWSIGTNNFGTGIRHHTTHYWLITITGLPYMIYSWRKITSKYFLRV